MRNCNQVVFPFNGFAHILVEFSGFFCRLVSSNRASSPWNFNEFSDLQNFPVWFFYILCIVCQLKSLFWDFNEFSMHVSWILVGFSGFFRLAY